MSNRILLIIINICLIKANWELTFNDEFNFSTINETKWQIEPLDLEYCDAHNSGRLNCYTNRSENFQLIDGTLAIIAKREKYLNKEYTSAFIKSMDHFTYGKFEVRAALPKGKMLNPFMTLYPLKRAESYLDEIIIAAYRQDMAVLNEVLYEDSMGTTYVYHMPAKSVNLNDFNKYELEWTQSQLIWRLNDIQTFRYNLSQSGQTFDKPFQLAFFLRVGGRMFRNIGDTLTVTDVAQWDCSALIIDYVRYYRWNSSATNQTQISEANNTLRDNICSKIMSKTRISTSLTNNNNYGHFSIIAFVSIFSFLLMSIFLPLVIYLWIKIRRMNVNKAQEGEGDDNYDDCQENHFYSEILKTDNNYLPTYESVNEYIAITNTKIYD